MNSSGSLADSEVGVSDLGVAFRPGLPSAASTRDARGEHLKKKSDEALQLFEERIAQSKAANWLVARRVRDAAPWFLDQKSVDEGIRMDTLFSAGDKEEKIRQLEGFVLIWVAALDR